MIRAISLILDPQPPPYDVDREAAKIIAAEEDFNLDQIGLMGSRRIEEMRRRAEGNREIVKRDHERNKLRIKEAVDCFIAKQARLTLDEPTDMIAETEAAESKLGQQLRGLAATIARRESRFFWILDIAIPSLFALTALSLAGINLLATDQLADRLVSALPT